MKFDHNFLIYNSILISVKNKTSPESAGEKVFTDQEYLLLKKTSFES